MHALETSSLPQTEVREPKIVSIASGKGGVGKTWFSITLAQALARLGRNVLLFDGDIGLANVDIQTGLDPAQDLRGVIDGHYSLDDAICSCGDTGFDVIAGRSGSGSRASISNANLHFLMNEIFRVSQGYDHVLLDLSAGIDEAVRTLVCRADVTYLVTNDEPTAITDAYALMKLTYQERPDADLRVVVNMAPSQSGGQKTFATLSKVCNTFLSKEPALAGIIRRDEKVGHAIRRQSPLLTRYPGSVAGEDVTAIAKRLSTKRRSLQTANR
ncbi:MAG: MinD/ParA family protein [Kiloniellales bacterium]|nr:MinD/ParA family protein [Kiloniellales bacterium]